MSNNSFSVELFCHSANTCQVFAALCAEDRAAPVAPVWVHTAFGTVSLGFLGMRCVRHWWLQEVHLPMVPEEILNKLPSLFSIRLSSRDHLIQNSPSDILKFNVANIYWGTLVTQIILLGLLTQAVAHTHRTILCSRLSFTFPECWFYLLYRKTECPPKAWEHHY